MKSYISQQARIEFEAKIAIKKRLEKYYREQTTKNGLESLERVKAYLPEEFQGIFLKRNILFAHLDVEPIIDLIAQEKEFVVVSGLNPSSPLHLGHKALFEVLLYLQKLGGNVFIPITNDESYIDKKSGSLKASRKMAYEEIIPSILAFGFNPKQTNIFVDSDYSDLYNFAMDISQHVSLEEVKAIFGEGSLQSPGEIFYRSAVQIAQILLPQLPEFGGPKPTLIPVGIDQHPYILLARDVAKKMKLIPPSEIVMKFLPSLKNPEEKMSGSKPETAIYLNDTPETIHTKINKTYTGGLSTLIDYQQVGGVPEICSVFALLKYHLQDEILFQDIYVRYQKGNISMIELKNLAERIIAKQVLDHQKRKITVKKDIHKFLLKTPLHSFLDYE